jgi:hypothetical protein
MAQVHEDPGASGYVVEQLCTIAFCGAIGGVAVMMWKQDMLRHILAPQFRIYVLIGGIVLLALVSVRTLSLWFSAVKRSHDRQPSEAHDHSHEHGSDCEHDHSHAPSEEGVHTHDHGKMPLRYALLLLPLVLYCLNLPNSGFSREHTIGLIGKPAEIEGQDDLIEGKDAGDVLNLGFKELSSAALSPKAREQLEGKNGRLTGQYQEVRAKECTLFRLNVKCCLADAIPLQVRILCKEALPALAWGEWVEVVGQIQFRKKKGSSEYIPVLLLKSAREIDRTTPDPNPYEY